MPTDQEILTDSCLQCKHERDCIKVVKFTFRGDGTMCGNFTSIDITGLHIPRYDINFDDIFSEITGGLELAIYKYFVSICKEYNRYGGEVSAK